MGTNSRFVLKISQRHRKDGRLDPVLLSHGA